MVSLADSDSDSDLVSLDGSDFDSDSDVDSGVFLRHSDEVSLRQSDEPFESLRQSEEVWASPWASFRHDSEEVWVASSWASLRQDSEVWVDSSWIVSLRQGSESEEVGLRHSDWVDSGVAGSMLVREMLIVDCVVFD